MTRGGKREGAGRPTKMQRGKRVDIYLPEYQIKYLKMEGNMSNQIQEMVSSKVMSQYRGITNLVSRFWDENKGNPKLADLLREQMRNDDDMKFDNVWKQFYIDHPVIETGETDDPIQDEFMSLRRGLQHQLATGEPPAYYELIKYTVFKAVYYTEDQSPQFVTEMLLDGIRKKISE